MNTMLKIKSRSIITGRAMRASSLLLAGVAVSALLGTVPSLTGFLAPDNRVTLWVRFALNLTAPVLAVLAIHPLRTGSEAWFLCGASGREPSAMQVAFWYKPSKLMKSVEMRISLLFRKLLWMVVFLAPGLSIVGGALYMLMTEGIAVKLLTVSVAGGVLTFLLGLYFCLLMVQRYFLAYAVLARDPKKTTGEAIRQSIEAMNGCCARTLAFRLSFLPWFLLCLAVLPIFYVWPYYKQSCSCLKYELCRKFSLSVNEKAVWREVMEAANDSGDSDETQLR